jgi:hypothetical protein
MATYLSAETRVRDDLYVDLQLVAKMKPPDRPETLTTK